MPRIRRLAPPGTVQHVITRFCNKEFRVNSPRARAEYLRRVGTALGRTDWSLLAFAVMSSHVHLALLAAAARLETLMRSLNSGFGLWLNRTQGRSGPVFEGRYRSISIPTERAGYLIAYQHNNPVRAGVVGSAIESDWTSHRYYLGTEPAPPWLAVELGLTLAGFQPGARGRAAFDEHVSSRAGDARDIELSGGDMAARRSRKRVDFGGPVELCTERALGPGRTESPVFVRPSTPIRPRWCGPFSALVTIVAQSTGVPEAALVSRDRSRRVVRARRIAIVAATQYLGRSQTEIAAYLGLSDSAASRLRSRDANMAETSDAAAIVATALLR